MTQTAERINIRNLAAEWPQPVLFDVRNFITEDDWWYIEKRFSSERHIEDKLDFALAMKIMRPQKFGREAEKLWREAIRNLDTYIENEARPEFPLVASTLKLIFGQKVDLYLEGKVPELAQRIEVDLDSTSHSPDEILNRCAELKVLFPQKLPEKELGEKFQELLDYSQFKYGGHLLMANFFKLRIIFPEKKFIGEIARKNVGTIIEALQFYRENGQWFQFAVLALTACVVFADKVEVTENGLEVTPRSGQGGSQKPTPVIRRF